MIKLFRNFLDESNLSETELDKFSYSTDASRIPGIVEMVTWPKNVNELQRVCQIASRHNIKVTPRGAGCNLVGGAVPENSVVVDMNKMNKILEIDNSYAYVEAGVTVKQLNDALANKKFPIIPLNHRVATIGGLIASNAFCSKTSEIGRMVDWVIEIEAVDGTGRFHKLAGDDIRHFVGLEGSTGIIAKAKLKLEPVDKSSITMMNFNTIDAMSDYLSERKDEPIRTDLLDDTASELLGFEPKIHLIEFYPENEGKLTDENEVKEIENLHERLDWKLKRRGYSIIEAPSIPQENVEKMEYWLRKNAIPNYAHLGCNIFVCYFKDNSKELDVFRDVVKNLNGDLSCGFGFGLKYKNLVKNEDRTRIAKLKEAYDPKSVMNKGKLI